MMSIRHNPDLCARMGLKHQQMRDVDFNVNLRWSLRYLNSPVDGIAFGFGDLDNDDLHRIHSYLLHPSNDGLVFQGWDQHHGTRFQVSEFPVVQVTADGITFPMKEARQHILKAVK